LDLLVGAWSGDESGLYHTAFEDECLVVRSDGSGWHVYSRPNYDEITDFSWREIAPGHVELVWAATTRVLEDGVVTERPSVTGPDALVWQVNEEDTPLSGRHLVLRIDPSVVYAREFGRWHRDAAMPPPDRL
jgi:hypothetical protein